MKLTHLSLLASNIAYGIVLNTEKYMLMCAVSVLLAWTVWFFVTISVFSKMCWLIVLNSYTRAIKITIPLHVQHCYSSVTTQRLHPECACCIWTILDNVAITTSWSGTVCHGKNSHTKPRVREVKSSWDEYSRIPEVEKHVRNVPHETWNEYFMKVLDI